MKEHNFSSNTYLEVVPTMKPWAELNPEMALISVNGFNQAIDAVAGSLMPIG